VASVLVTSGAGRAARRQVEASLGSVTPDLLVVRPAEVKRLVARRTVRGFATTLRREDAEAIADLAGVAAVSPAAEARGIVKSETSSTPGRVLGTAPSYAALRRFRLAEGRFFDADDERASARVAVLGARVARSLFGDGSALGRTVRVGRVPFEVIGVLEARGAAAGGADEDDLVAVPLSTALRRVLNATSLSTVFVSLHDPRTAPRSEREIRELLRLRHRLEARGAADDFEVQGQEKMASMQRTTAASLTTLTRGLAAVALAVGGAGILTLMLLAVRERSAEIGLRIAVGATPPDVLLQFLAEAAVLGLGGGAAGALLGLIGAAALARATGWSVSPPASAYALSLGTSLAVGLAFGAAPAWLASRVPPAEALAAR
jgi:putative ABC transport system permease protein